MIREKKIITTFILIMMLLVGLTSGNPSAFAQEEGQKAQPAPINKKPIVRNGVLRYYGQRPGAVKLKTIPSFLALYSDEELTSVIELSLEMHELFRIEGLKRLPNLKILRLLGNQIETISGLEDAPGLEILNLTQNRISRIDGLGLLLKLRELYLGHNLITRIENLSYFYNLEVLDLEWNKIRKIEGLGSLQSLRWLLVGGNQLEDYSGLLELDHVKNLSLASPSNVVDEKAIQVFKEWNRRHPDEQITY